MSILTQLGGLALEGAADAASDLAGGGGLGKGVEVVAGLLRWQFADNSRRLPRAIERAAARAWRAVEVALAGKSWWDRCKVALATGDARAIRAQVQAYLDANPLDGIDGHGPDFRIQCVAQLQAARKAGLLDRGTIDPEALARQVGDLSRFGDPSALIDAEHGVLVAMADGLRRVGYDALATFLCLRPAGGPPLLVAAMRYFFRREVESDQELFQALSHARTEKLAADQQAGFADLAGAMDAGAERLEGLLADVQAVVAQTHGDVLDIKAELARQGRQMGELGQAVLQALARQHLDRRELHGGDSLSIRDEGERRLVRDLVKRYRAMPAEERHTMPALLNAVGKLEVMAGDFDAAEKDFREVAAMVDDGPAKAEAAHNAYRAALERRAYADALGFLRQAMGADPVRFAPFPADKYEAEKILGAGGFGVAILCRNRHSGGKVVIKTLRRDGLDRDLGEVFREAQALEELEHPAIIRIRDCDYADAAKTRPFFVMDFFAGQTLADHVEQYGTLEPEQAVVLAKLLASGLERAHARGILHRDVKPGNILVRPVGDGWEAKLIDFGLALRPAEKGSTAKASIDRTLAGASIAGTLEYAAPEQMGKLTGVAVGTYSDVYGFGKTCCFALFGTPQPTFQHWKALPPHLAELLGRCLDEKPRARPQDFAEVLRELDRPVVEKKAERVPFFEALLEALPVEEAPKPAPRPVPRREPEPAPQPRADRDRDRRDRDRDRDRGRDRDEPRRKSSGGRGVAAVGCLMFLVVAGGILYFLFKGASSFSPFTRPFRNGTRDASPPWMPDLAKVEEVKPEEFPALLEELTKKPELPRLREIAGRLMKTTPTEKQQANHRKYKQAVELKALNKGKKKEHAQAFAAAAIDVWAGGADHQPATPLLLALRSYRLGELGRAPDQGDAGPPAVALDLLAKEDEIRQVSLALQPLLEQKDDESRWYGAKACQKWGTEANVVSLMPLTVKAPLNGQFVRGPACLALGTIGDLRGLPSVIARAKDPFSHPPFDEDDDLMGAIVAFGPEAQIALWPLLSEINPKVKGFAIQALGRIGTEGSLAPLENAKKSPSNRGEAATAIDQIRARLVEKDK